MVYLNFYFGMIIHAFPANKIKKEPTPGLAL
jgi:hypothetical protein